MDNFSGEAGRKALAGKPGWLMPVFLVNQGNYSLDRTTGNSVFCIGSSLLSPVTYLRSGSSVYIPVIAKLCW